MKNFTAFCQDSSGQGTIWISTVLALTVASATRKARIACAKDWGTSFTYIHVLGIAEGDVKILEWNDLNEN